MRFGFAFFLAAMIFAAPVWGQDGSGGTTHNFGRILCPQKVPCPGDSSTPVSSAQFASMASGCITQYFGYASPSGFFDPGEGLDSNGCLTPIDGLIPKGMGAQLIQACCVVQAAPNTCAFRCELNTQ